MAVPIPDLRVDSEGISGTLSFSRKPFKVRIPWDAIFALKDEQGRRKPPPHPGLDLVRATEGAALAASRYMGRGDRLGADHPQTAWTEVQLADLLIERGGLQEAAVLAGTGLVVLERRLPPDHDKITTARSVVRRTGP